MSKYFLILPVHLFDKIYLDKDYIYVIYEHPHYFTSYSYNKKKLMLHRSSMKYYYDYLIENDFTAMYIEYNKKLPNKNYEMFDPIDDIDLPDVEMYESPSFLMSYEICERYNEKTKKFFFTPFYYTVKEWLNIYPEFKSTDKLNRKSLNKTELLKIPSPPETVTNKYVKESIKYVNKHFPNNPGTTDDFFYPVTHDDVKNFFIKFIKERFIKFGDFQDAITQTNNTVYHSLISSSLNIGLITPGKILKMIKKVKNIPENSLEGFVRQLFWREYQRYCFINIDFTKFKRKHNTNKLNLKWYNGTLNILPVDNAIKRAFETGYLHHIERLMIVGNFMNLSLIKPEEGFKWFMEFSCDSYEWVMYQNVYDMVFHVTNGKTTRRPYISSSNYVLKMSDYKKESWCSEWNKLYNRYIEKYNLKYYKKAN